MKTIPAAPVRIVKESVRIDACAAGDELHVPHVEKGHWNSVGFVRLERIKPIQGGRVQIKYRQRHSSSGKVLKADLPAGLVVERSRPAVEADGPDAGVLERRVAVRDDVRYAIDPEIHPDASADDALLEDLARRMGSEPSTAAIGLTAAAVAISLARGGSKTTRIDPDIGRMDDWLGAFEDRGILQPGARERLMSSVWTDRELSDGRPSRGVVIDG